MNVQTTDILIRNLSKTLVEILRKILEKVSCNDSTKFIAMITKNLNKDTNSYRIESYYKYFQNIEKVIAGENRVFSEEREIAKLEKEDLEKYNKFIKAKKENIVELKKDNPQLYDKLIKAKKENIVELKKDNLQLYDKLIRAEMDSLLVGDATIFKYFLYHSKINSYENLVSYVYTCRNTIAHEDFARDTVNLQLELINLEKIIDTIKPILKEIVKINRVVVLAEEKIDFNPSMKNIINIIKGVQHNIAVFSDSKNLYTDFCKATNAHQSQLNDFLDMLAVVTNQNKMVKRIIRLDSIPAGVEKCFVTVSTMISFLEGITEYNDVKTVLKNMCDKWENKDWENDEKNISIGDSILDNPIKAYFNKFFTFEKQANHLCIKFKKLEFGASWLKKNKLIDTEDNANKVYKMLKNSYAKKSSYGDAPADRGINATISQYLNAIVFSGHIENPLEEINFLYHHGNRHHSYLCLVAEVNENNNKPLVYFDEKNKESSRHDFIIKLIKDGYNQDTFWKSVIKYYNDTPNILLNFINVIDDKNNKEYYCTSSSLWGRLSERDDYKIRKSLSYKFKKLVKSKITDWSEKKDENEKMVSEIIELINKLNNKCVASFFKRSSKYIDENVVKFINQILTEFLNTKNDNLIKKIDSFVKKIVSNYEICYMILDNKGIERKTRQVLVDKVMEFNDSNSDTSDNTIKDINSDNLKDLLNEANIANTDNDHQNLFNATKYLSRNKKDDAKFNSLCLKIIKEREKVSPECLLPLLNIHWLDVNDNDYKKWIEDLSELFLEKAIDSDDFEKIINPNTVNNKNGFFGKYKQCFPNNFKDYVIRFLKFVKTENNYYYKTHIFYIISRSFTEKDFISFMCDESEKELSSDMLEAMYPSRLSQNNYVSKTYSPNKYIRQLLKFEYFEKLSEKKQLIVIHYTKRQDYFKDKFNCLRNEMLKKENWNKLSGDDIKVALILSMEYKDRFQEKDDIWKKYTYIKDYFYYVIEKISDEILLNKDYYKNFGYSKNTLYYHIMELTQDNPKITSKICRNILTEYKNFTLRYTKRDFNHIFFTALQNPYVRSMAYIICNRIISILNTARDFETSLVSTAESVFSTKSFKEEFCKSEEVKYRIRSKLEYGSKPEPKYEKVWIDLNVFEIVEYYLNKKSLAGIKMYLEKLLRTDGLFSYTAQSRYFLIQALASKDNKNKNDEEMQYEWFGRIYNPKPICSHYGKDSKIDIDKINPKAVSRIIDNINQTQLDNEYLYDSDASYDYEDSDTSYDYEDSDTSYDYEDSDTSYDYYKNNSYDIEERAHILDLKWFLVEKIEHKIGHKDYQYKLMMSPKKFMSFKNHRVDNHILELNLEFFKLDLDKEIEKIGDKTKELREYFSHDCTAQMEAIKTSLKNVDILKTVDKKHRPNKKNLLKFINQMTMASEQQAKLFCAVNYISQLFWEGDKKLPNFSEYQKNMVDFVKSYTDKFPNNKQLFPQGFKENGSAEFTYKKEYLNANRIRRGVEGIINGDEELKCRLHITNLKDNKEEINNDDMEKFINYCKTHTILVKIISREDMNKKNYWSVSLIGVEPSFEEIIGKSKSDMPKSTTPNINNEAEFCFINKLESKGKLQSIYGKINDKSLHLKMKHFKYNGKNPVYQEIDKFIKYCESSESKNIKVKIISKDNTEIIKWSISLIENSPYLTIENFNIDKS